MINTYYILINGEKTGPYTQYEIMNMDLDVYSLILSPLADDWQSMSDLPEFNFYFEERGIYLPTQANLASFWWRLLAYVIDYIIVMIFVMIIAAVYFTIYALTGHQINTEETTTTDSELLYRLLTVMAMILYHSTFEATKLRGSIGKVACKLCVVDADGHRLPFHQAFKRNCSKLLSSLVIGIGFLKVLWDDHRQGWHDEIAKTYVIRRS